MADDLTVSYNDLQKEGYFMRKGLKRFAAMMTLIMLLTSALPALTLSSAESEVSFSGSFAKSEYTMAVGETLKVKVNASVTNATLTRVTINVDRSGNDRLASKEVDESSWSGSLTLDASVAPLNVPGTYTIKLFAGFGTAVGEWAEVDRATLTVEEVQYDDLEVDIEVPSEVTVGDSLTARSVVSGGSGDYTYLWTWTHPNGIEMTDPRKNCSILGTVLGTYVFTLTVTDNVTGETCTSKTLTVEIEPSQETYDPMEVCLIGDDECEVELAMVGIGAECTVTGGSGNFEYGWEIERDGTTIQSYSYGMVDDVCTWKADKVGVYTFRVSVKDLETGLIESASCSVTVVQKEYDPLTIEITSAPKYADLGETVQVVAETTGGVGSVIVTWEVYRGKTRVASGNGLSAEFVPDTDEEYTVVFSAEDEAQTLEDRTTILAGNHVKCKLSVSSNLLYVGDDVVATATVQDGIGPFSYEWSLSLNGNIVSSEYDSQNTTYSWNAAQEGVYQIDCTIYDLGGEEILGKLVYDSDSAEVTVLTNPVTDTPKVLTVRTDMQSSALLIGEEVTITVVCSKGTELLDVYDPEYQTLKNPKFNQEGYPYFEYTVSYDTVGEKELRFVALNAQLEWSDASEDQGFLDITVCKLPAPVLTVSVDGNTMFASWAEVENADRYIFSLRKTSEPDGEPLYNHVETDGCSIELSLEPDTEYRLAVAAVPVGVEDTHADNGDRCSWAQVVFTTGTLEDLNTPKVLTVQTDMRSNFLLPGEKVTITVVCNKVTEYLDVYDPNYQTLQNPKFNKDGYPYFEYTLSYADIGKKTLRFVALGAQLEWSDKAEHQGVLEIIVCDHSTTQEVTATSKPVKKDKNNHTVTETYQETCLCGKINNTGTRTVDQPHSWGSLQISSRHVDGRGHRCYYKCACGEEKDNGYTSFVKNYAENNKCAACRARYDLIKELQTLLIKRGYSVGKSGVDGVFGNATKEAMNAFRKDVMGLSAINDVDEATMAALRGGDVLPTPESTDAPEAEDPQEAGFITSPADGASIAFFNTGALTVLWQEQPGCKVYTVELLEDGNRIFIGSTQETYMLIKVSDIESYTKEDWYVSHTIQINVTSIE